MLVIPDSEIELIFSRASGKGGQNVNKTSTRVQLRWNLWRSKILENADKEYLAKRLSGKLTGLGDLIVVSDSERSQNANLKEGRYKLTFLVNSALKRPKIRRKTRPSRASKLKRLDSKRFHSEKKKNRKILF